MVRIKKLVVLVPCYNEEEGIALVIDSVPKEVLKQFGYETAIVVIDNNCTDKTSQIAQSKGAKVIKEPNQGKGYAVLAGLRDVPSDADFVAMIDGDGSYDPKELPRMLEPLENDFGDVIVGSRLHGKLASNSMSGFNRVGNWLFTFLARVGYKTNVTDVCSGFFAWKRRVIEDLAPHLKSRSFSIEMEMIAKLARMNCSCYSVPISYNSRNGRSSLRPVKDGIAIFYTWLKNITWKPVSSQEEKNTVLNEVKSYDIGNN